MKYIFISMFRLSGPILNSPYIKPLLPQRNINVVLYCLYKASVISVRICRPIRHDLLQILQVLQVPRPYQDRNLQNEPVVLP